MRESALNLSPEVRERQRKRYDEGKALSAYLREHKGAMTHCSKYFVPVLNDEGKQVGWKASKGHTLFKFNNAHKAAIREDKIRESLKRNKK